MTAIGKQGTNGAARVFAFDLGNVLLEFDVRVLFEQVGARCHGGATAVADRLQRDDLVHRFEVGQITGDEFFGEMQRSLGFRGSFEEFAVAFSDIFRENTPMIELMRVLKRRFPVYLLSNTNEIHIGFVEQRHPFLREFDGYHYSFRVGARKPDAQYYRGFVEQYGFAPSDVAFVDDILPNVDAARAVGMCGVHYQNAAQARAELLRLAGE